MLKIKYNIDESIAKFKAKLIFENFLQVPNIYFEEMFILIVRKELLQIYLVIYLIFNLFIH